MKLLPTSNHIINSEKCLVSTAYLKSITGFFNFYLFFCAYFDLFIFNFVYKPLRTHDSSIHSDEGLTLETSTLESLKGGQFSPSIQLIKPNESFWFLLSIKKKTMTSDIEKMFVDLCHSVKCYQNVITCSVGV